MALGDMVVSEAEFVIGTSRLHHSRDDILDDTVRLSAFERVMELVGKAAGGVQKIENPLHMRKTPERPIR